MKECGRTENSKARELLPTLKEINMTGTSYLEKEMVKDTFSKKMTNLSTLEHG
jgi:hypothetical protein